MRAQLRSDAPLIATLGIILGVSALISVVGADARWLAALGRIIVNRGSIPRGVPFAVAPTGHWPNVLVLAEVIFDGLERALGDRGLMLAQLVAVVVGMTILARDGLAGGAGPVGMAWALLLAALGLLPSLAVARVQLFSLILFPAEVALLRSEVRRPSWRIWLVVALLALWSNLHGAALIGLGLLLLYLALVRLRQDVRTAVSVGVAAPLALGLTPAGIRTVSYYYGVLTNQAAARGQGLWAPLSLTSPLDVVLVLTVIALAVQFVRAKPPRWELVAAVVLAVLTVRTARSGVWLSCLLTPTAARAFRPRRTWHRLLSALGIVAVAGVVISIARGPVLSGGTPALIDRAVALAHGTPVLAEDLYGEQVALAGGRIWVGDPIDAFSRSDQIAYLNWMQGRDPGGRALAADVAVVIVGRNTAASRLMARASGFSLIESDRKVRLYGRTANAAVARALHHRSWGQRPLQATRVPPSGEAATRTNF